MMISYTLILAFAASVSSQWIEYPDTGLATMSHYGGLSNTTAASCGCEPLTANYATAALSQMVRTRPLIPRSNIRIY